MKKTSEIFALALAVALVALPAGAELVIATSGSALRITDAEPGSAVVICSATREWERSYVHDRFGCELTETDGEGSVRWVRERGLPPVGLWAAVAIDSGELAFTWSGASEPAVVTGETFSASGDRVRLETHHTVSLVWVRPGRGAWTATARNDAPSDLDPGFGIELPAAAFEAVEGVRTAAPGAFAGGDLVIGLDTRARAIYGAFVEEERN